MRNSLSMGHLPRDKHATGRSLGGAFFLGAVVLTGCHPSAPPVPNVAETNCRAEPAFAEAASNAGDAPTSAAAPNALDANTVAAIDSAVSGAIRERKVPGAVIVIGRHDRTLFQRAYGQRQLEPAPEPMTLDTVFDLASLTKPIATATSIFLLVQRGLVGLDDPLAKYVAECGTRGKERITIRQLLLHTSGLPSGTPKDDYAHGRPYALRHICDAPLRSLPGTSSTYTDLGYLLLEEVVRRVTAEDFASFVASSVLAPLGMHETGFLPPEPLRQRAASTEKVDGVWRVGVVHDPRAFNLGGVAGHAGLFSTAGDLTRYAQALLGGGETRTRVLIAETVNRMTAPYDVPDGVRTLGWSMQSSWRGQGLSPRAFGHFGWTGTALWIDPDKDLFVIVLTNRVHPDGTGDAKPLVSQVATLAARAVGPSMGAVDCAEATAVSTGIDVLRAENFERLRGANVGLITNATGRTKDGASTIDVLRVAPGVSLVALFAPEHGLGSDREGAIANGHDERTGLPLYSLYGESFAPSDSSLVGIDTLVFDIQDAGTRYFTYASTMRNAMATAAAHALRFVVLDRPNPIDGVDVEGPVFVPVSRSFVNYHSLPIRHGMTLGELAYLLNADDAMGVALRVVPMRGWKRAQYYEETGLPWVHPSPNLRSVDEAILYPAVGLLESTNVSVGRGTPTPFELLGAPWMDGALVCEALGKENLPGVAFAPTSFAPTSPPYAGQTCGGIRVTVTDRAHFQPVRTGLAMASALRRVFPTQWEFRKLERMVPNAATLKAIDEDKSLGEIEATYASERAAFVVKREKYLLYRSDAPCGE